jgi:transcriptional regulator with GAF, ATPase, and Fis domain
VAAWQSALVVRAGACGLTLLAVAIAVIVTADAIRFIGRPWAGFGMLPDGSVAPLALSPLRIGAESRGLAFDDRIVAVDGMPVDGAAAVRAVVERVGPEVPLRYTVRRGTGTSLDVVVPTTTFTVADWSELFLPPLLGGLALGITLGLLPVLARPDLTTTRLFFLANIGLAVNFGFLASDAYVVHHLPRWGFAFTGLALGTLLHLALLMPQARAPLTTHPWPTLAAIYGAAAAVAVFLATRGRVAVPLLACFANAALSFFIANYALAAFNEANPLRRRQARVVLASFIALAAAGALLVASTFQWVTVSLPVAVYLVPLWICGGLLAYAMLELNLFDLGGIVRRGLTAGILAVGAVGVYLALYLGLRSIVDATTAWAIAGLTAAILATVVLSIASVRRAVERLVERTLFPGQREARDLIYAASRELARLRDVTDLGRLLRDAVASGVAASTMRLVSGPRGGPVEEVGAPPGAAPLVLAAGDPIAAILGRNASVRFAGGTGQEVAAARGAVDRARELGVHLAVSLPSTATRVGGLLLGQRTDGRPYTREDERVLETLAAQTAVALDNARAWEEVRRLEQRLAAENLYLREEVQLAHDVTGIVGDSEGMRSVLAQAEQVAATDATIMVQGETGTGKELVVHAIHAASLRKDRALVKIACAALPEQLLESELFGHERGAFTGAVGRKAGRFEVADGGTIFFDDVDTLPLGVQAKLLRALQEGEVQRLGSNEVRRVDVRVIAATNRDLLADVRAGRFREDLYYRLNVVPLRIPPLRERREDIALLVEHFIRQDGQRLGRSTVRAVSSEALEALRAYAWPGNVRRELRNVIQRALVLSRGEVLRLPGPLEAVSSATAGGSAASDGSLAEQVRELKVRLIRSALAESSGNQRLAAERLGMHRQSLTRMIRDLGLQDRSARGS